MQPKLASVNSAIPITNGIFLPHMSLKGPAKICPSAMPTIVADNVIWINDVPALNSVVIEGNAGRYISVASGASAVKNPSRIVSRIFLDESIFYKTR